MFNSKLKTKLNAILEGVNSPAKITHIGGHNLGKVQLTGLHVVQTPAFSTGDPGGSRRSLSVSGFSYVDPKHPESLFFRKKFHL